MSAIKLYGFGGMQPAVADRLLPDNAASYSRNTWLYSGELTGINEPTELRTLGSSNVGKAYRIPTGFLDKDHLDQATWMEFEDTDTDVVRTQVVGDTYERYYWASNTDQPKYNSLSRIEASSPEYLLGIPAPSVAPTVVPAGGVSATTRTSAYVYTWVSTFGEEGPPSPPTTTTGKVDDTWAITVSSPAADDVDGPDRDIDKVRIYRTVTAATGVASYFLVAEQVVSDTTYDDTSTDATVSSNSALDSTYWSAPPTDLKGWVSMPNGIVAGWRENEVWFCEPYRLHAWPASYALAVDYPVVGLGVIGQTLVVCTQSYPFAITGVHPASMSQSKIMNLEPCMSRSSIVSSPEGVYYASPNGLVLVANGRATNVTKNLITKDKWQTFLNTTTLSTLRAARLGNAYYWFGSLRPGVFETTAFETTAFTQYDYTGAINGVLIDPSNERVAFNILYNSSPCTNSFNDPWTGELFVIRGDKLYWINTADDDPTYEAFLWRSKIFQAPKSANYAVVRVYFEVSDTAPTLTTRNTNSTQTLSANQYGVLRVYADDRLVCTREIRTNGEILRLPSGFKAQFWQFEIEGRVKVTSLQIGASVKDLAQV